MTEIQYDGGAQKVSYAYDAIGRVSSRIAECGAAAGKLTSTYTYVDGGFGTNSTTPLVKKITQNGISFEYEYDSRGNIVSEKRGNLTTTYAYDALGQLIRVNDPHENATWVYSYDRGGNILSKAKYAYTTGTVSTALETIPYTYGDASWKDKLTAYNDTAITYDAIGNPLNDGAWTFTWAAGRQLKKMVREDRTLDFKYDHNGMRIQKVLQHDWYPETTNYTYHGKLLTHMTVDYHDWDEAAQQDKLHFFYDAQSRPVKISYNGVIYTYVHNLQGDIVGILDSTGALVVEYKYDAWGKLLSTTGSLADTLGKRNPFRYRGYVYDEESELYYLRSRYYNPVIGRFVNADCTCGVAGRLISHSAFTYCSNAPVDQADDSGKAGNMVSKMPNTVAEAVMRTIINAICGRKHASNLGKFSVKSVTRNITITKESADKHNSLVEGVVGSIAFIHGAILGTYIGQGPKVIEKIAKSTLGGIATDAVSAAIQDVFIDAFTVRPGTYTSILCQYERNFKVLFFLPGVEVHTYELRIYPDYCEVWYSYLYSGFGTTITPSEKVGEMTLFELKEALGGQ